MIKSSDLHKVWSAPDNSRLTAKQYSFRLPVHVAAKLAALGDMYPNKTRTEIVGDLLAGAIEDVVRGLPPVKGAVIDAHPETQEPIFEHEGPYKRFLELANKHYEALERELGNENPGTLPDAGRIYSED